MKSRIIGAAILIVIIAAALGIYFAQGGGKPQLMLKGFVGGEKTGFLEDEEIKKLLKSRYGITLDYSKAGSIEMVREDHGDADFLWPSSQVALEIFKTTKGQQLANSENIFNSPIVFYSWDIVADKLKEAGILEQRGSIFYVSETNFPKLVDMVLSGKKWAELGLEDLFGSMTIITTDPLKSNSGNMFFGLLANVMNGDVVNESSVLKVTPRLKQLYDKLGYLEHSSSDLFDQYMKRGVGDKPLIVGYENQIIEFAGQNKEYWEKIKGKVRIIYPEPTVWSSHPLIALNAEASELVKALEDKDIQRIAWEKHGFRTGSEDVENDIKALHMDGIPDRITKITPMPNPQAMDRIMEALQGK